MNKGQSQRLLLFDHPTVMGTNAILVLNEAQLPKFYSFTTGTFFSMLRRSYWKKNGASVTDTVRKIVAPRT